MQCRPLLERVEGLDVVVVVDQQRAVDGSGLADDRGRSAVDARGLGGDPGTSRSREDDAGGLLDADLLGRDGRLSDERLQLVDVLGGARANVLVEGGEGRHARRLSLRRNGRRARLALAELAARRERRHFDPALLAEVVHEAVEVLEGLAPVHLGAWEHVHAVAAVVGERRPRPVRVAGDGEREREAGKPENDDDEDDREAIERAHIRVHLPSVPKVSGGGAVSSLRMIVLMLLLAGTLAACGGAGPAGRETTSPPLTPGPGTSARSPRPADW